MVAFKFENEVLDTKALRTKESGKEELGDIRFRQLLSQTEWYALPKAVRDRFGKRVAGGQSKLNWLTPGMLTITHKDLGEGWFEFGLTLKHKYFGCMLDQTAKFHDVAG